jgi:MoaA/NifB/PqqE/SkfB family radical SAM enzyme
VNRLEKLYQEFGDNICLCPFFGAFYQTNNVVSIDVESQPNSVRPCSLIMYDDRNHWDVKENSIAESRNSTAWRQMRQDFLDNKFNEIASCKVCRDNEQSGATSPRMMNNKFLCEQLDTNINEAMHEIVKNDLMVSDIITLDYYPSNYCNYSCVMCSGGASSQRQVFELKFLIDKQEKIVLNAKDPDFYELLKQVEIINFTGGETVLQKQVYELIDYLIQEKLASNITITLLTNASSYPEELMEKFSQFKGVVYNISIDGIGDVIEYQRRGCSWSTVEANSVKLLSVGYIGIVINYVLTAINVFSVMDFVDWAYSHNIGPKYIDDLDVSFINISPVFRLDFLGQEVLPSELKKIAVERLQQGKLRYSAESGVLELYYTRLIDRIIYIVESAEYRSSYLPQFKSHIRKEDTASKKSLIEVVPEWAPYFQS